MALLWLLSWGMFPIPNHYKFTFRHPIHSLIPSDFGRKGAKERQREKLLFSKYRPVLNTAGTFWYVILTFTILKGSHPQAYFPEEETDSALLMIFPKMGGGGRELWIGGAEIHPCWSLYDPTVTRFLSWPDTASGKIPKVRTRIK